MAVWFTSDTHFGHSGILSLAQRPFADADEMDGALVRAINERVGPGDELYHLGDFSYRINKEAAAGIRRRIRCRRVHLVPGNHDKAWEDGEGFLVEPPIRELKLDDGTRLVLCHYPLMSWNGMHRGSIHLHGHIHSGAGYNESQRDQGIRRFDVGVDANGYAPVSLDDVLSWAADASAMRELLGEG